MPATRRRGSATGVRARNFAPMESAFAPEADPDAQEARLKSQGYAMRQTGGAFFNHMGAEAIRASVGARIFEGYFKFAVERDPRERLISYYYWLGRDKQQSFREFVAGFAAPSNWQRCTIDGRLALDRLIRHDRLEAGLRAVMDATRRAWDGSAAARESRLPAGGRDGRSDVRCGDYGARARADGEGFRIVCDGEVRLGALILRQAQDEDENHILKHHRHARA